MNSTAGPYDKHAVNSTPWASKVFGALFVLLIVSFYFLPDQAGRNLILYATALSAHAFLLQRRAWSVAYGHPGGWVVLLLVLMPCVSLVWSTGVSDDAVKDLLVAAYCVLAIYVGVAWAVDARPRLADHLAVLVLAAGNLVGAVAVVNWAAGNSAPGVARLEGLWGIDNPVHASVLLLAGTLTVLSQVLSAQRRLLWLAGVIIPFCFVVLAGARTAAGAYLVVAMVMVTVWKPRASAWVVGGTILIAAAAVALLGTDLMEEVWLARGLSYRDAVWEQVWSAYRECNAAVGCGLATPLTVDIGGKAGERAHSIFVAALYYQGLVGLLLFAGSLAWLLWAGLKHDNPRGSAKDWAWMLGYVLLANFTSGDHVLVRATLFWPCFWLPVMVVAATSRGSSRPGLP